MESAGAGMVKTGSDVCPASGRTGAEEMEVKAMDIGDSVEVIDIGLGVDVKIGAKGKIVEYHYTIECWWEEGHPLDHKVTVNFPDGRHGRKVTMWSSDLKKI